MHNQDKIREVLQWHHHWIQLEKLCNVFEMASRWGIDLQNLLLPRPLQLIDLTDVRATELMIIEFGIQCVFKGVNSQGEDLPSKYNQTHSVIRTPERNVATRNTLLKHTHDDATPRIRCTACNMCACGELARYPCQTHSRLRTRASARSLPARSLLGWCAESDLAV